MMKSTGIALLTVLTSFTAWSQEVAPLSEAEHAFEAVQQQVETPSSELSVLGDAVAKTMQSKGFENKLQEELSKYKIKITIDPLGNILESSETDGGTYYQYVVEPAFRNNEQIRKDIWVIELRLGSGAASIGGQVRLTFSRFFSGPDAKNKALKAPIKWFHNTPFNTNEVKSKLSNGDGFRFEVSGDIAVGLRDDFDLAKGGGKAFIRVKRGGLFIMDIFKVNENLARTRFIGMKNRGELEAELSLKSPFWSIPIRKIRDALSIGFGGKMAISFPFYGEPLKIDTMMVDYLFNFSTSKQLSKDELKRMSVEKDMAKNGTAEAAMEQIFTSLKHGGFSSVFLFFYKEQDLYKDLIQKVNTAESIAKYDLNEFNQGRLPFKNLRVFNYFRGTILSYHRLAQIYGKFSDILRGDSQSGTVHSYVTSYDENFKGSHFWLDNSFTRHASRSLFGRNKYNLSHDVDVLVLSDKDKNFGNLSDVVVRTQIEDTKLSEDTMADYKKIVMNSLPEKYRNDERISSLFKNSGQTNAYLSYRHSYGEKAFKSVGKLDRPSLTMKIIEFFKIHPERQYMHLPTDDSEEKSPIGMGTYAEQKAYDIADIFNPDATPAERMEAFRNAKNDSAFERYLVGEFFSHLLPKDNPDPLFGFDIKFSSAESGTSAVQIGENRISRIYDAVSFMRSIINDQSLDMQMTSSEDNTGGQVLVPSNQDGFLAPLVGSGK